MVPLYSMCCLPFAVSVPNNRPIHHLLAMMLLLKHLFSQKWSVRLTERMISQHISCPYLQIKRLVFADSWRICGEMYLRLCHLLFIISSQARALHGWMLFHSEIIWESAKLLTLFAYYCVYNVNLVHFTFYLLYIRRVRIYIYIFACWNYPHSAQQWTSPQ